MIAKIQIGDNLISFWNKESSQSNPHDNKMRKNTEQNKNNKKKTSTEQVYLFHKTPLGIFRGF